MKTSRQRVVELLYGGDGGRSRALAEYAIEVRVDASLLRNGS